MKKKPPEIPKIKQTNQLNYQKFLPNRRRLAECTISKAYCLKNIRNYNKNHTGSGLFRDEGVTAFVPANALPISVSRGEYLLLNYFLDG